MTAIVLIRGVPGSGKTTKAKAEYPDHELIEADQFFMSGGEYCYDGSKIKEAHEWCKNTAKSWLERGHDVVVANTFTRVWEMQPYLDMGYPVKVVEATGNYDNVHGVPTEIVERMRERFEAYSSRDEIERLRADAERYRWRKENPAIEVDVFRGRYRCTARDSVLTDWLDSYDEAIDAAMQGANV